MVLGIEIALTIMALYMLITGKSVSSKKLEADGIPAKDWRFRLLGGAVLTFWPLLIVALLVFGVLWFARNPQATQEEWTRYAEGDGRITIMLIEGGIVVAYAVIATIVGHLIDKSLRRRAATV